MRNKIIGIAALAAVLCSSVVFGAERTRGPVPLPVHSFEIGPEIAYMEYREPDVMRQDGFMYGLKASYTYRDEVMFRIEGRSSYSEMDYKNSGEMNNLNNYVFEARGLVGYDIPLTRTSLMTPYIGFGYRWLYDDSGGHVSTTGAYGYDRESNYYYTPLGIETYSDLGNGWSWGMTAEFDYFWEGRQYSYLSDASPVYYSDADNKQNDGYGLRGSVRLQKKGDTVSFVFEPFVRYWEIDKSDYDYVLYGGVPNSAVYEPKNETIEIGALFMVLF